MCDKMDDELAVDASEDFIMRLMAAAEATLEKRSLSIFQARYGLYKRRPMSEDEIAASSGQTVEQVHTAVEGALERLHQQGQREILEGCVNEPCARLVLYVRALRSPKAASETEPEETSEDTKGDGERKAGSPLVGLLVSAIRQTLDERDAAIFMARYGLEDGRAQTLSAVGDQFGITRERARQIIEKGVQRLTRAAKSARRRARYEEPCAQLADYIRSAVNPDADNDAERLLVLMRAELPHLRTMSVRDAAMLPARFLGDKETAADYAKRVRELVDAEQQARREEKEVARHDGKLDALLMDVIWPSEIRSIAPGDFGAFAAARSVSPGVASENGAFASRKLGRLVEYESALEHDFLQLLEGTGTVVFYQEQPFRVPYEADSEVRHTYPDVFFVLDDGRGVVVEVAPNFEMAQQENWVKWHGLRVFCRERGYGLLITDGRRTFHSVSRHEVRPEVRESLLAALDEGPMRWPEYQIWRDTSGITTDEFYAIVIRERLEWRLRPYRLARG